MIQVISFWCKQGCRGWVFWIWGHVDILLVFALRLYIYIYYGHNLLGEGNICISLNCNANYNFLTTKSKLFKWPRVQVIYLRSCLTNGTLKDIHDFVIFSNQLVYFNQLFVLHADKKCLMASTIYLKQRTSKNKQNCLRK